MSAAWLRERGIEGARLDAEILVAHGLSLRRLDLYLQHDRALTPEDLARVRPLLLARSRRVPVAYLTGEREFHGLSFHVDPAVLIPRPETEHLVDAALDALEGLAAPVFADVGTGSGCVAVSLLHALPASRAHATDVSGPALVVAKENARRHGVLSRLSLHEGDLLAPLRGGPDWGRLDAVVSNPPYVVRGDPTVEPDVRDHEPASALYVPGADPLALARRVAQEARAALRPGGLLALEVGMGSAPAAREALAALGYAEVRVLPDLAGIERIVTGISARGPTAGS